MAEIAMRLAPDRPGSPAHLLHIFPTLAIGGPQRRFVSLVQGLGAGWAHSAISLSGNYDIFANGEPPPRVKTFVVADRQSLGARLWQARRTIGALNPDLVITYNWGAIEWAFANNLMGTRPTIDIEDGFNPEEAAGEKRRRQVLRRLTYRHCARVVVPSTTLLHIAAQSWHIPQERLSFIPNGIDCTRFNCAPDVALLRQYNLSPSDTIIGTISALRAEKNLPRLIRAFIGLPARANLKLVIAGDGPERTKLEQMAALESLADRIIFTGPLANPERLLSAFTIYANSSDTEQMPLSILEAMAAGLPIAATNVGDVRDMVDEANRSFITDATAEDLRGALAGLLARVDLRQSIGRCNQEKARRHYSVSVMIEHYDRLFSEVARSHVTKR